MKTGGSFCIIGSEFLALHVLQGVWLGDDERAHIIIVKITYFGNTSNYKKVMKNVLISCSL